MNLISRMRLAASVLCDHNVILPSHLDFPASVSIKSPWDTLNACRSCISNQVPGAYLRFGDGDVNLLEGYDELYQNTSPALIKEMKAVFGLQMDGLIKGLPLHSPRFGIFDGMTGGVFAAPNEWAVSLLQRCFPYFIGSPIYSSVALAYLALFDRPFTTDFLCFLKSQRPLFVGNESVPESVRFSLFGEGEWVPTRGQGSFSDIDDTQRTALALLNERSCNFDLVVTAMGCAGRVLAKRLLLDSRRCLFVFDFGSLLDAFCGWNTRAWIELSGHSAEYFQDILADLGE